MRNDIAKVPYIGVEFERHRSRRIIKLLAVLLAVAVIVGVISNVAWKIKYDEAVRVEMSIKEPYTLLYRVQYDDFVRKKRKCGRVLKNTTYHEVSG